MCGRTGFNLKETLMELNAIITVSQNSISYQPQFYCTTSQRSFLITVEKNPDFPAEATSLSAAQSVLILSDGVYWHT